MNRVVYKYLLNMGGETVISCPEFPERLMFDFQAEAKYYLGQPTVINPYIWMEVDLDRPVRDHTFRIFATGEPIPVLEDAAWMWIQTRQQPTGYVWHLYEKEDDVPFPWDEGA